MYDKKAQSRALALLGQGHPVAAISKETGVCESTLYNWRNGATTPHGRGPSACPRCESGLPIRETEYAYLLGLYLGDGHIAHCTKGVFRLDIDCADSWPGLIDNAAAAMGAILPNIVGRRRRRGCTTVSSSSKHWPHLFPQHGPGRKHERKIELEPWQRKIVDRHPGDFVRGLMHSDGYRGMNRVRRRVAGEDRWYEYPRYLFKNESKDILELCGYGLDLLDVTWRYSRYNTISVAKRDAVARLDEFVGPKY